MDIINKNIAKSILEKTFGKPAKFSSILHKGKVIQAVQLTTDKGIDSETVRKLGTEMYEEKLIADFRFSRSGYGITVAIFDLK